MWWDLSMVRKITLLIFTHACLCVSAFAEVKPSPGVAEFVELVKSSAKSETPLSAEQYLSIAVAAFRLNSAVNKTQNTTLLNDEVFLTAVGNLISVSKRLSGKASEDLDVCNAFSRLLKTVFWSKDLTLEDAKRVLTAQIGILKRLFEEDELLKKEGAAPGMIIIDDVVYVNSPGPTAEELKKQASTARCNYVERGERMSFEHIWRATEKFKLGTDEARVSYLKEAGLTAGQIEKCQGLIRKMNQSGKP